MTGMRAKSEATEISMQAIVIRADGSTEDLGTIAYWHKNPLKRWSKNTARWFRTGRTGHIS